MFKRAVKIILIAVMLLPSSLVFADYRDGRGGPGGGPNHGFQDGPGPRRDVVVHRLPPGYQSLRYGGFEYLYCDGFYYRYSPAGYVVIAPPAGMVVPSLPPSYTTVVIQQVPYYYYGGVYYAATANGYVVAQPLASQTTVTTSPVALPDAKSLPKTEPDAAKSDTAASANDVDNFEIHIPNENGSYTLVTLKKTEKGFLGPQGEFYADHPTVEQLKDRYVKK